MKLLNSREDSESDHGSVVKREKREASRMRECKEYILCLDIRIQSLISQTTKAPTFWADPSLHWIFKVWFESLEGFDTLISLFVPRWNSLLKILNFFFHVIYKKSMDGEERFGRANNGHQLNMEREGGGEREGHMEAELEREYPTSTSRTSSSASSFVSWNSWHQRGPSHTTSSIKHQINNTIIILSPLSLSLSISLTWHAHSCRQDSEPSIIHSNNTHLSLSLFHLQSSLSAFLQFSPHVLITHYLT